MMMMMEVVFVVAVDAEKQDVPNIHVNIVC